MSVAVYKGCLVLTGGYDGTRLNDAWYSADGTNWFRSASVAPFTPRRHHATMDFNGSLWLIGGNEGATTYLNDVWFSWF